MAPRTASNEYWACDRLSKFMRPLKWRPSPECNEALARSKWSPFDQTYQGITVVHR